MKAQALLNTTPRGQLAQRVAQFQSGINMQLYEIFQYIFLGIAFSCLIGFGVAWYVFLGNRDK